MRADPTGTNCRMKQGLYQEGMELDTAIRITKRLCQELKHNNPSSRENEWKALEVVLNHISREEAKG